MFNLFKSGLFGGKGESGKNRPPGNLLEIK